MIWRGITIAGVFTLLVLASAEKDLQDTCSFHYRHERWKDAVSVCEQEHKRLLCYKSREEIDDITEAFRLSAFYTAALNLWLSNRNCSMGDKYDECLSLHVTKSQYGTWHFFQTDCEARYTFVCCLNGTKQPITSTTTASTTDDPTTSTSFDTYTAGTTADNNHSTTDDNHSTAEKISTSKAPHCKQIQRRGVLWPDTAVGEVAVQPCPGKTIGRGQWLCENVNGGRWKRSGPNMTSCRSWEIENLKEQFNRTSASNIISEMEKIFAGHHLEIFGKDLADLVSLMAVLPARLYLEMDSTAGLLGRWTSARRNVEKTLTMVDRLIELDESWEDIEKKGRNEVGTDLLTTVEGMGSFLANSMSNETEALYINKTNLVLQVIKPELGRAVKWVVNNDYENQGTIILEEGFDKSLEGNKENMTIVFALFTDLTRILSPDSDDAERLGGGLNSPVLSASISLGRKPASIDGEVRILVEHFTLDPNGTACVFWNMKSHEWDTTGCRLEDSNSSHSVCICNHLTNFALLMDYTDALGDVDSAPFHYITVVGCSLSIVCLFLCVVIFSCYSYHSRHSWGLRYVIHRNLCLCLLVANFVLVIGLDRTENQRACAVIAGLLHYFFLAAFSWMLLEGVHIYLLLVVVFASRRSHSEKYYAFGYGFPLLVVSITAISRPTYYGTEELCWLSPKKGTIWGFMGPVAVIVLLNTAALLLAQWKASKIKVKDDKVALVKRWLRVTFILFPILGITWIFGFLYVGQHFEVAGYLFAIFNSFQGVCIFVFHCLLDKKARNMVMDSFKKKSSSVNTGSSGTQKKAKDQPQNEIKSNSITVIDNDLNKVNNLQAALRQEEKRNWSKWRWPPSFWFEMPVSKRNKRDKKQETFPRAVAVQWNNVDRSGI